MHRKLFIELYRQILDVTLKVPKEEIERTINGKMCLHFGYLNSWPWIFNLKISTFYPHRLLDKNLLLMKLRPRIIKKHGLPCKFQSNLTSDTITSNSNLEFNLNCPSFSAFLLQKNTLGKHVLENCSSFQTYHVFNEEIILKRKKRWTFDNGDMRKSLVKTRFEWIFYYGLHKTRRNRVPRHHHVSC